MGYCSIKAQHNKRQEISQPLFVTCSFGQLADAFIGETEKHIINIGVTPQKDHVSNGDRVLIAKTNTSHFVWEVTYSIYDMYFLQPPE